MKFVDELYEYYKNRLTGDEEDAEVNYPTAKAVGLQLA